MNVAILRYKGASLVDPTPAADVNIPVLKNALVEENLRPLVDVPVPGVLELGKADVSYTLRTDYNVHGNGLFTMGATGGINETFIPSKTPILLQILSGARQAKDLLPSGVIYTLPAHKVNISSTLLKITENEYQVIEITLPGTIRDKGGPVRSITSHLSLSTDVNFLAPLPSVSSASVGKQSTDFVRKVTGMISG